MPESTDHQSQTANHFVLCLTLEGVTSAKGSVADRYAAGYIVFI